MPKALIVDDSSTARMYYRDILEDVGFSIEEAANGLEGLEKALSEEYDIMVVDVNMPKMDGYTLLTRVRTTPAICALPAMMISTEARDCDQQKAHAAGANFYIVKPVDPNVLATYARLMTGLSPQQRTTR